MNLREADNDQDDLDADDDLNRTPLSLANDTDLNFTQTRIDDSFLYSDDRTNTMGGNSSVNFGLSGSKGYFQNNLQGMLEAAQAEGRIKRDENGNLVEGTVAAEEEADQPAKIDLEDSIVNFNLTATQHGLP